jgi:hypothetical protein
LLAREILQFLTGNGSLAARKPHLHLPRFSIPMDRITRHEKMSWHI